MSEELKEMEVLNLDLQKKLKKAQSEVKTLKAKLVAANPDIAERLRRENGQLLEKLRQLENTNAIFDSNRVTANRVMMRFDSLKDLLKRANELFETISQIKEDSPDTFKDH